MTSGSDANGYAEELFGLAMSLDSAPFTDVTASPMARRSTLEGRLKAILDRNMNRAPLTRLKATGAATLVAAVLVPISMLRGATVQAQAALRAALPSGSSKAIPSLEGAENISKSFSVQPGGTLRMDLEDSDVEVIGTNGNEVSVTVERMVHQANGEKAARLLREHEITFGQNGNDVTIRSKTHESEGGSWFGRRPSLRCRYRVTTPYKYNLAIGSGGGNIRVEAIEGNLTGKSGGGSLIVNGFAGPQIQAGTGGGKIVVDMVDSPKESCTFSSGGGDIHLKAPEGLAVNLAGTIGGGTVKCEFPMTPPIFKETDQFKSTINSGGPELKVETGGGDIRISKR